jgi:hypothetical protein
VAADRILAVIGDDIPRHVALSALLLAGAAQVETVAHELAQQRATELSPGSRLSNSHHPRRPRPHLPIPVNTHVWAARPVTIRLLQMLGRRPELPESGSRFGPSAGRRLGMFFEVDRRPDGSGPRGANCRSSGLPDYGSWLDRSPGRRGSRASEEGLPPAPAAVADRSR